MTKNWRFVKCGLMVERMPPNRKLLVQILPPKVSNAVDTLPSSFLLIFGLETSFPQKKFLTTDIAFHFVTARIQTHNRETLAITTRPGLSPIAKSFTPFGIKLKRERETERERDGERERERERSKQR